MAKDLPEGAPVMLRMSVERESGYLSWLGMQMQNIEHGAATLEVPFDAKLTDRDDEPPTVHHGIVATLMEQAGEIAVRTTMPDPVNDRVDPLSLDCNFLNEAAHDLTADAEVVDRSDGSGVATVTVRSRTPDGNMSTIATGQGVYRSES